MSDTAVLPRRLEHQDRFWTGLEDAPERPDDTCFKPVTMAELRSALDLEKFLAASDLVCGTPESRSSDVENFKAIGSMIVQVEAGRTGRMLYARADAKNGEPVFFFAWEADR